MFIFLQIFLLIFLKFRLNINILDDKYQYQTNKKYVEIADLTGDIQRIPIQDSSNELINTINPLNNLPQISQTSLISKTSNNIGNVIEKKLVYFSKKFIDFGEVSVGTLHRLKVTVCNSTNFEEVVYFSDPELPFAISHHEVIIPPNSYIRLPIRMVTITNGIFQSILKGRCSRSGNNIIELELYGSSY